MISIYLKFEGLKLQPVVIRLYKSLTSHNFKLKLLWPDAGATALAKRQTIIWKLFRKRS